MRSRRWAIARRCVVYGLAVFGLVCAVGITAALLTARSGGYPPIGVYFADCPSAGHDMLCLDYRECGSAGEPRVVHVDQEFDYRVTAVADDFESFLRGLVDESEFDGE